jgi:galactofuranose transport system permease protein
MSLTAAPTVDTTEGRSARILRHRLFWPTVVLIGLLLTNLAFTHSFFDIQLREGHLYGSLVDILRGASALALVSLGMTMVIATGGIDLSVGSVMAISGALACLRISDLGDQNSVSGVTVAVVLSLALGLVLGLWNGILVAVLKIQPIVATLILMVAGRGLAQLITDGQIITVVSSPYKQIGAGYLAALPVCVLIVAVVVTLTALVVRRSALGMLLESVGANPTAGRLAGIQSRRLVMTAYVFAAFCAAIAGLIYSSNVSSADGNNTGNLIELDAILAVVIGGTALTGGRFSIGGSILGSVIITALDITVYTIGVPTDTTLLFKAIVVIVLCLLQSPSFRARVFGRRRSRPGGPPAVEGPDRPDGPSGPERVEAAEGVTA